MGLDELFIDPEKLPDNGYGFVQLIFLLFVYGYILASASNLISDGSELLLLVPSLAGVVGSCVLPVLGAVPDGAIVLFSGLGPNAQEELQVGIGALAGSTIMLLTLPWCLAIFGGRVSLDEEGRPVYRKPSGQAGAEWEKLDAAAARSLTKAGVAVNKPVRMGGIIMGLTAVAYLFIQIPAFILAKDERNRIVEGEKPWALAGLCFCIVTFFAYLCYQFKVSQDDMIKKDRINEIATDRIAKGEVSLLGVMAPELSAYVQGSEDRLLQDLSAETLPAPLKARIVALTRPFFHKYDYDGSGLIDVSELHGVLLDLGDPPQPETVVVALLRKYDSNGDGLLDLLEFSDLMVDAVIQRFDDATEGAEKTQARTARRASQTAMQQAALNEVEGQGEAGGAKQNSVGAKGEAGQGGAQGQEDGEEDEAEEEAEEVPDDLKHLTWAQQQRRILLRSVWMMGMGTLLVLLFSDPMVGVLSAVGRRLDVSAFYISFVLAPLASNASELIASYNYAKKKTSKTINIALATLTGAGCMNNTFTLAIFLLIIYVKGLVWEFSAETVTILLVEVLVLAYSFKEVHTVLDGLVILSFYPLSLLLVAMLERYTTWN